MVFWKLYWVYSEEDAVPSVCLSVRLSVPLSVLPQSISKDYSIKHVMQAINHVSIYVKTAYLAYNKIKHRAIRTKV
jgi:hypothetical protein